MDKVKQNLTLSEGEYDLHLMSDCINDQPVFFLTDSLVTVTDNRRFPLRLVCLNNDDTSVEDGTTDLELTCNSIYTHKKQQ